jgi:hypothetical protein
MSGHGEKLSRKQEQAIAALLTEPTIEAAAVAVKVGYRTLKGWLTQPPFAAAYRLARRAVVDEAIAVGQKLTTQAMEALGRNLTCQKPGDEIRAALGIFAVVQKSDELDTLAEQLAELRQAIEELRRERVSDAARGGATAGGVDGAGSGPGSADPGPFANGPAVRSLPGRN